MSEIFFEALSRKEWNAVSDYITASLPNADTDRDTIQTLVEFQQLVAQFCSVDEDETEILPTDD